VGDPINLLAYTNLADQQILTGVAMDDLPYIALLALIVGAGIAFLVIKYRKAAQQNAE
jgi:hypothetical protein